MSPQYLDVFNEKVDLIQIGARNMQNFDLLKQLGQIDRPILLKGAMQLTKNGSCLPNTLWRQVMKMSFSAAWYRTFETYTRNTLDLQCIPVLRKLTHLPIIIDPSHAGGKWWLVDSMAMAAVAAGADGLMIEVHNNPEAALCDGAQSLKPEKFDNLVRKVSQIAHIVGKEV